MSRVTEEHPDNTKTKCGYVAVIGRPNVGKSTLLNRILGQKVSIVTNKPQTTRDRLLAVHTTDHFQIIFLDTPGIHRPVGSLGHYMNEAAMGAIQEADILLWLIDVTDRAREHGLTDGERVIARRLTEKSAPVITVLNKVDMLRNKQKLLPIMAEISTLPFGRIIVPISARTGDGVYIVLNEILEHLPVAPPLFPDDIVSDKADKYFVSELVREALTLLTHKEVPYKTAVIIDRFVEEKNRSVIHATIHVERDSQKGIMIGKGGQKLVEIGTAAREQIELMLGCKVLLHLHVNVTPDWTSNPAGLRSMGYE